jgi:hypothetical protein
MYLYAHPEININRIYYGPVVPKIEDDYIQKE